MASLIRNPKDFWTGVIFAAAGGAAVVLARGYPMGSTTKMGPAYFPTVLGGVLAAIGLIAIARSLVRAGTPIGRFAWKEVALVLAANVLFGALLRGAGLVVALIVLVMVSAYASARFLWGLSLALAVGLAVFSVLAFVKGLGLPIPALGSWFGG